MLGGWQVSFLFKAQSGAPLGFGNFCCADGFTVDDITLPADQRTVDRWFNVDAFERATNRQLVSNVRTQPTRFEDVRGPGYAVLDLGILKNVDLDEPSEAAVARGGLQRDQSRESRRAEYDADEHGLRDDHGAERAAASVPAGSSCKLLIA